MGASAQGKKTSWPLRMPIEPGFSSVIFGQTCPIETAVGEPAGRPQGIVQWRYLAAISWKRPAPRSSTPSSQTPGLITRFDAPADLAPSCFSPGYRYAARQAFDRMAALSQNARAETHVDLSAGFQSEDGGPISGSSCCLILTTRRRAWL
jgi:hypothetical protein